MAIAEKRSESRDAATLTREELVRLLNEDLAREYQAIIAYVIYSQVLKGAQYMDIAAELETHAKEELQHALVISKQIDYLGGMPTATRCASARRRSPRRCYASISTTKTRRSASTVHVSGNAKHWVNTRWPSRFARFLCRSRSIKSISRRHSESTYPMWVEPERAATPPRATVSAPPIPPR
jgi:Ferritin-like domain